MKLRDMIKFWKQMDGGWLGPKAAIGSIAIRRNRERLPLRVIRQWTFRRER